VFQRVVHDMGISPEAFMATDILVTIGDYRDRKTGAKTRRVNEIVGTTDSPGEFVGLSAEDLDYKVPVMRRALSSASMSEKEAADEIRARGRLRGMLAELGKDGKEEFLDPGWIIAANETVARMSGRSPEEIESAFRVRIRDSGGRP
jgi:PAS domain-containing protein